MIRLLFFLIRDTINTPNLIIIQRSTLPFHIPLVVLSLLNKLTSSVPLIWDIDDNIFFSREISENEKKILLKNSIKIIISQKFLQEKLSYDSNEKIITLATTDKAFEKNNFKGINSNRLRLLQNQLNLVWVGTESNIHFLEKILHQLELAAVELLKVGKELHLITVSSRKLDFRFNKIIYTHKKWSRQASYDALCSSHIGLMPLTDNEYTKGKAGFKLVQYLSAALPVIASQVGFNNQIVDESVGRLIPTNDCFSWSEAIIDISSSNDRWCNLSKNAKSKYDNEFSYSKSLKIFDKTLMECIR